MSLNLQTVMNQRLKMVYTVMQCHTGTLDRNYLALYPGPTPSFLKYISIACSCIALVELQVLSKPSILYCGY